MFFPSPLGPRTSLLILLLAIAPVIAAAPRVTVEIEGISGQIRDTVRANLSLQRERDHPLLTPERIELLHQRAAEEIRSALQPFGYYHATVQGAISHQDEAWRVHYQVAPGQPVRVATVAITLDGPGADDPELQRWRDAFPLAKGDILLDQIYEEAKDSLLRIARERGYLDGQLTTHELRVNTANLSAEIRLHFVTGARMRFGPIAFKSEVPLDEALIARYPDFSRGEPYDAEKLYRLHRDLTASDYFERVEVLPRTEAAVDGEVPVEVGLTMRKRDRYTAGLGYGTDTGPRASLGFERRWLNGAGHRFSSEAVISDIQRGVVANYRIPLEHPTTDFLGFTGSRQRKTTKTAVTDTSTVGANVTRLIGTWQQTVSLDYLEENYEVGDTNTRSTMLYPGVTLQHVEADDRFFPIRGWRLTAEGRIAAEDYWSATSLLQGRISGKMVMPLFGGRLLPRFDLAGSLVDDFEKLPASLRYFAGGDQSVRGFAYQSLGPTNDAGDVIGGTDLLVGSLEYDHFFGPRFGAAVFTDAGNAFNSFKDYELHRGSGVGLRWRLPVGVVRFDVAWAVSDPERPWRIHFTIGPDL